MSGTTLFTGADGYLGGHLAARVLAEGEEQIVLTVRAADTAEFCDKRARLATRLPPEASERVSYACVDLRKPDPFGDLDPEPVTRVVHAAAVTRLNVGYADALAVNVEGTSRAIEWARRCPRLQRFALISTLYASGRMQGIVAEGPLPDSGFVNHYEWSKWESERIAIQAAADIPISILRVPTLIAEDDSGRVVQFNAFHNTLKLLFYGLLSFFPGTPATKLPVSTAAFVSAATTRLLDIAVPDGIYNVCPDSTATLGELMDAAFTVFESDDRFRRLRMARPAYCDSDDFTKAVLADRNGGAGAVSTSLGSVAPFAEQLCIVKEFQTAALRTHWPDYQAPDPVELATAATSYLVETRWGRYLEETA
ncbi:MAG TPA: SDR family oxidoreductase [Jatrophihabitans sp.]